MLPLMHHLVGAQEIQRMLGVSRQRVYQLTDAADFPDPVAVLAAGKVWHREDVETWAHAKGRDVRDDT